MRLLSLLLALALAACDSADPAASQQQVDADLVLALGETGRADGLTITFERVVSDSRCPEDVVCVWAGIAEVELDVSGETVGLALWTPEAVRDSVQVGGVVIKALALTPYPNTQRDQSDETPVLSLRVGSDD